MRQDYGFGVIAAAVTEPHRDRKKKARPFEWTDFMPQWKDKVRTSRQKTPQELKAYFENVVVPHFNARANQESADG